MISRTVSANLVKLLTACLLFSFSFQAIGEVKGRSQISGNHEQGQIDTLTGQHRQVMPQHQILADCLEGRRLPKEEIEAFLRQEMNVAAVNQPHPVDKELLIYLMA